MGLALDTWVSLIAVFGFGVTLFATVRSGNNRLRDEMSTMRGELKGDIARLDATVTDLRTELKGDIARLDDRVYALAVGLKPQLEQAQAKGPAA